jgi:serine/threonine protein kinase
VPLSPAARSQLYYVMSFHAGSTLQQQLDRGKHFTVAETAQVDMHFAKGLGTLHRLSVVHRDIKPANLLQSADGGLRILDLGVALAAGVPYGEVEPFQIPRFGDPVPPTRYRPDTPRWIENLILRAVARDSEQRFETAEEMLVALEHADARPLTPPQRTPLIHRTVLRWRASALILLTVNLLLLYYIVLR